MTWIPGTGELASRLARALRIKGRIATEVDEQIIATVQTQDLGTAPYRTEGRLCREAQEATGDVASVAQISILNLSAVDQVVKRLWIQVTAGQDVRITIAQGPVAGFLGDDGLVTSENVPTGLNFVLVPLRIRTFQTIGGIAGRILWESNLQANVTFDLPFEWVLKPNAELVVSGTVIAGFLAVSVEAQFFNQGPV